MIYTCWGGGNREAEAVTENEITGKGNNGNWNFLDCRKLCFGLVFWRTT